MYIISANWITGQVIDACRLLSLVLLIVFFSGCRPSLSENTSVRNAPAAQVDTKTTLPASQTTAQSNAQFTCRNLPILQSCDFSNGRQAGLNAMLEIVGGGVGCIDMDNDGRSDMFFPRGGHIDPSAQRVTGLNIKILRSLGPWEYVDSTAQASVDTAHIHSHGVSEVDYDHDGYSDVLVYGFNGAELMHNMGDGTFNQVAAAVGLTTTDWTTAVAWMDFDNNGALDVYLGSYLDWSFQNHVTCPNHAGTPDVCSPNVYGGQTNSLFLNQGDGTFVLAPDFLPKTQLAKTLGVLAAEFIAGQGTSLYVTNDMIANFFFARRPGGFEEQALAVGVAVDDDGVANASMGIAVLDFNLDLKPDIFVTNFEHEKMALYLNYAADGFHYHSRPAGLNRSDLQLVGFGVVAADFDGDADEDVLFCSGHVHYYPDHGTMEQLPAYLQNEEGKKFVKLTPDCRFFHEATVGRGMATADLDNDGDLDVVSTSLAGPPAVLENIGSLASSWVTLQLVGTRSPRLPVGATVELMAGQYHMMRQLTSGGSYLSQSQNRLHFAWPGLRTNAQKHAQSKAGSQGSSPLDGPGDRVTLKVRWPSGQTSTHEVSANRHLLVVEEGALP